MQALSAHTWLPILLRKARRARTMIFGSRSAGWNGERRMASVGSVLREILASSSNARIGTGGGSRRTLSSPDRICKPAVLAYFRACWLRLLVKRAQRLIRKWRCYHLPQCSQVFIRNCWTSPSLSANTVSGMPKVFGRRL